MNQTNSNTSLSLFSNSLDALPADVVVAKANLALETRVLPVLVARLTLERLGLDDLTGGLVLELVVLAEEVVAE